MITGTFLALALLLGYAVAVGLSLAATFWITAKIHEFVVKEHRIRRRYKFVQAFVWLLCTLVGGYITAAVAGTAHPLLGPSALAVILVLVLWINTWEMRQRGFLHQALMSLVTVVGVAAGCMLRQR